MALTGPGREILGDVQGIRAGFLAEETRLSQQSRQGGPRRRDGDMRGQGRDGDVTAREQTTAGGVQLRGFGFEGRAEGTIGGDLEGVPDEGVVKKNDQPVHLNREALAGLPCREPSAARPTRAATVPMARRALIGRTAWRS